MTVTLHKPDEVTFAAAVRTQRDRLEEAYVTNDYLPHVSMDDPARLRVAAPKWARMLYLQSLGHVAGAAITIATFVAGWRIDRLYVTSADNNGLAVAAGLAAGIMAWALLAYAARRVLRPHVADRTRFAASLYVDVDNAVEELRRGAEANDQAARLHEAALGMYPVLEVLADEELRLAVAVRTNRYAAHRSDYRTALKRARFDVCQTMLDVTAELMAAASVVFASRDDLLVELAEAPNVSDVVFRDTLVTAEVKTALETARQALREAATVDA